MSRAYCPDCGHNQPDAGVCAEGCDGFALVCQDCDGEGWFLTARPDGSHELKQVCDCLAGELLADKLDAAGTFDRERS